MKKILPVLALTTLTAAAFADAVAPAAAPASAWSQSANIAFTSNYVWRGVSQTDTGLAVQGGFDVAHTSGFSAGVWGSNVNDYSGSWKNGIEVDLYANYAFQISKVDFSVGYIAYYYQSFVGNNFSEINVSATYAGVTAKISKEISNGKGPIDVGGEDYGYYYELGYNYNIPAIKDLVLGLHYGWTDSRNPYQSPVQGTNEDYSVSLSYPVVGYVATAAYSNCPGSPSGVWNGPNSINKDQYSITLKKTF